MCFLEKGAPVLSVEINHFFSVPIEILVEIQADIIDRNVEPLLDHLDLLENIAVQLLVLQKMMFELDSGGFSWEGILTIIAGIRVGIFEVQLNGVQF